MSNNAEIWKQFRKLKKVGFTAVESLWLAIDEVKLQKLITTSLSEAVHYHNLQVTVNTRKSS